jgi:4-alpha-glucanotransferase
MHVTSLPSPYGIGDVGPAALAWVDTLHAAGQKWWQALPLGPTGFNNSPYSCLSSFAGNTLLISPDLLIKDGVLGPSDCEAGRHLPKSVVDFDMVIAFKQQLLDRAWRNFERSTHWQLWDDFERFCSDEAHWLDDYALFRALKARFAGAHFLDWPQELLKRNRSALVRARRDLADEMYATRFGQFLIFRQGQRLKHYAHERGVSLIGDLPFFVSLDSSDVWANPENFQLDANLRPKFIAGVPPDYFSAEGQLWGNPVYDWEALHRSGYRWCIDRLKSLLAHVDLVRLDHFRAFCAAWHVPPTAKTAEPGRWFPGPGAAFFEAVRAELGHLPFIAEDLGIVTPDVVALRDKFELPGTRVFQFGFDGSPQNPHLPHNYVPNTVAYTGTHDNTTTRGWFVSLPEHVQQKAVSYTLTAGAGTGEVAWAFMRLVWTSKAGLAIAPLQDLLNLGEEGRMNVPGIAADNWRWRCTEDMLKPSIFERLRELTTSAGRMAAVKAGDPGPGSFTLKTNHQEICKVRP